MMRIGEEESIGRRYLFEEVADRVRALILSGELEPKSRVNEPALIERFGISRTPLREALKILSSEGLIDLLPNRGARIASISPDEIDEMIEVVAGLEAVAAELACQNISDEELKAISAHHDLMMSAWSDRDADAYFRLNREIHHLLVKFSHNRKLAELYATLAGRIQAARYIARKTKAQWDQSVSDHTEMMSLLKERRGEDLGRAVKKHIRSQKVAIEASFGKKTGTPSADARADASRQISGRASYKSKN